MSLNDFEIGTILGKGAFGSVAIVTRKEDRKTYAMKRINISKLNDKEKENALNEIRILASLSHPNIIGYKEAFFDEPSKTINIVMEYADDGDIDKKIKDNLKKRNFFTEDTIWGWIIQILEGLKYLHDNKIMHRDLKCANIFLMKDGILKLGDLNVSKIAKLGMAQTQAGTPYYISPEIWKEQPYDYKCDIWSVGCIIYEICTLRPPFRGNSLNELYRNIMNGYYLPISNIYSNDLKTLISMMLVIDNKKRASTDELLNSNIIKKWIQKLRSQNNNKLGAELVNNYTNNVRANLIKTIKMPKNLRDINNKLPKKRYNPSDEMMKNDKYEIMKETLKNGNNGRNKKMDLSWLNGFDKDNKVDDNKLINYMNNKRDNYNNNYNNNNIYNNNNNYRNNNNYNIQPYTPNYGKYNYLNKYDKNMNLINNERNNNNNNYNNYQNYRENNFNNNNRRDNLYSNQYNNQYNNNNNYNDRDYNNRFNRNEYNNENNKYRNNNYINQNYNNDKRNYNNDPINYNYRRNYENNNYYNNNGENNYNYNKNANERRNFKYEDDIEYNNKKNRYNNYEYNNRNIYNDNYSNENRGKNLTPNRYMNYGQDNYHQNRTPINRNDNQYRPVSQLQGRNENNYNQNYNYNNNKYNNNNYNNNYNNKYNNNYSNNYNNNNNNNNNYNNYNKNDYNNNNNYNNNYNSNKNYSNESNSNNYDSSKKSNRYKFMFVDDNEDSQQIRYNNNSNNRNNNNNQNYNNQNNYRNDNRNNNYNRNINNLDKDRRDIGPRYNLYDFRYTESNEPDTNNNQRESDEVKIIFQKINYNDYCQKNNFDKNRNYHFYRENGYYNYNQAMKNYQNINNRNENHRYH